MTQSLRLHGSFYGIHRQEVYTWEQGKNNYGNCATDHFFAGIDVSNQSRTSPDQIKQVQRTSPDLDVYSHTLYLIIHASYTTSRMPSLAMLLYGTI